MTSNQIAFREAIENSRHNKETESETERHNLATEKLQSDANAINAAKAENERNYQSASLSLTREIETNKLALQKAQGDEKLRLTAELNALEGQKIAIDEAYKVRSNELRAQELDNQASSIRESARHNVVLEGIEEQKMAQMYWATSMNLEYQNRKLETESGLKREEIQLARDKLDADIVFRTAENNLRVNTADSLIRLQAAQSESQEKLNQDYVWNNFYTNLGKIFGLTFKLAN